MVATKTIVIGGVGISIFTLIGILMLSGGLSLQMEGDVTCAGTLQNPCEWHYNITNTQKLIVNIQNQNATKLTFDPSVKAVYYCRNATTAKKVNTDRSKYPCGIGWEVFNWTSKTKNVETFKSGQKKQYKIVVFKFNPSDKIKFGGNLPTKVIDPFFLPVDSKGITFEQNCVDNYADVTTYTNTTFTKDIEFQCLKNSTTEDKNGTTTLVYTFYNSSCFKKVDYNVTSISTQSVVISTTCKPTDVISNGVLFDFKKYGYICCFQSGEQIACEEESQSNGNCQVESGEGIDYFDSNFNAISSTVTANTETKKGLIKAISDISLQEVAING